MNEVLTLPATPRDLATKVRNLRNERKIPAEYYGKKKENLHLAIDYQTFRKVFRAAGSSSIVNLAVEGESEPREILVQNVDYNPLTDEFLHLDLMQIERGKKMITKVPIRLTGESSAVKTLGGILTNNKAEIEIKCLPKDLLKEIVVDIAKLEEIGATVRVKDLEIDPKKYEILDEEETMLVTIIAPKTAEEAEEDLAEEVGEAVSDEVAAEGEEEKAAALASKESDTEKKEKGGDKK